MSFAYMQEKCLKKYEVVYKKRQSDLTINSPMV